MAEPDLFTFGAPAAFRGYYWNWSRELFKPTLGATTPDRHRLWSWVILKAYTSNHRGTVRLRSASPFDMPEICFDAFNEKEEQRSLKLDLIWQKMSARRGKLADAGRAVPPAWERRLARIKTARGECRHRRPKPARPRGAGGCGGVHAQS